MRQNPFQQLNGLCEGAPHEFDGIVACLIRAKFPEAKRVRVCQGDGGVDTSYGDWGEKGSLDVFQVKYFPGPLDDSRKAQIRDSYKTASNNENFRLRRWILCLPTNLRQEDHNWFDTWRDSQDCHIELWDGDNLEDLLGLPGASRARDRLQQLGAVGVPQGQAVLLPILHVLPENNFLGTRFHLQLDLRNDGDRSAHDVRLIVRHSPTQHATVEAFQPWVRESTVANPRSLSTSKSVNPGETLLVMAIPFGQISFPVEVAIQVTCRDTPKKEWRAMVVETSLSSADQIPFQEASLSQADLRPRTEGLPEFGPANDILDQVFENPESDTRGVSVILKELSGAQPGQITFYATTKPGSKHLLSMEKETFTQAMQELIDLRWLKDCGRAGATRVFSLLKDRPQNEPTDSEANP